MGTKSGGGLPSASRPMDNRNRYPPGTSTLLRIQQMEQVNEERGGGEGSEVGTEGGRETDGVCSIMKERPLRSKKPTGVITKSTGSKSSVCLSVCSVCADILWIVAIRPFAFHPSVYFTSTVTFVQLLHSSTTCVLLLLTS